MAAPWPNRDEENKMVMNIAHRGARSVAPENTVMAGRKAVELGADLWEVDVAVTCDEVLILFHDTTLERTTNVRDRFPGRSKDAFTTFSFEELRQLDAGTWFTQTDPFGQIAEGAVSDVALTECREQKIPSLEDILIFTREAGFAVNLELKDLPAPMASFPMPQRVMALVNDLGMGPDQIIFSSFNHGWLRQIMALAPQFRVQALIGDPEDRPLDWGDESFSVYNALYTWVEDEKIRALARKNIGVNLWTVNDEDDMKRFIAAGAQGIITDFPQRLKRLTGTKGR
ncbi:MAG TPA: glycerophosphodiester phosphodiesterase [Desulfobacteraceae bacterium]|nr:glycerophosphodiester phosphodiesterase [Desulfobacteraceae bacterium]|tara:strand:+ start:1017 stop:1871 length:855 start_codon:yes stop_codon:yes gene_type:complete